MKGQQSLFAEGDIRGLMDYPYCPTCHRSMSRYASQCENCGQLITWELHKKYLIREGMWEDE